MWYLYTMEYYSAIKKKERTPLCSNMDESRECHIEWNKSDREREVSYDIPHMWNIKWNDTNELKLTKQKQTHREGKILYDISYMGNLKRNYTNELIIQKETQ